MWGEPVSDDWYGRIFAHARPDQLCGEVTPEYGLLPPEGIEHVKRLNPRMKIIFLMRDPVERCWSHLRMLGQGREDFDYLAAARNPEVLARADYGASQARWQAQFGAPAMFSVWMEDAQRDVRGFFAALLGFLGLSWQERVLARAGEAVFQGPALDMPPVVGAVLEERCRAHAWRVQASWGRSGESGGGVGLAS
jgi:hypothetical protein